jgi:hypothetical protein
MSGEGGWVGELIDSTRGWPALIPIRNFLPFQIPEYRILGLKMRSVHR